MINGKKEKDLMNIKSLIKMNANLLYGHSSWLNFLTGLMISKVMHLMKLIDPFG